MAWVDFDVANTFSVESNPAATVNLDYRRPMMQNKLIAAIVAAGAIGAGIVLAAPASADAGSVVGCSPCDRVGSAIADSVKAAAEEAGEKSNLPGKTAEKWVTFPGKTAEKWANFPGDTAKKWTDFPGKTAEKWGGFPGRVAKKWAGLG